MKEPSTDTPDVMKQSDASIENTFGPAPEPGSQNTSKAAQCVNRTKISLTASKPQYSEFHQALAPSPSPTSPWISSWDYLKVKDITPY
jgi:hypothetical protein